MTISRTEESRKNILARLKASPEFLNTETMLCVFRCSKATLYREIRSGRIPRRIRFLSMSGWYRDDIFAAIESQRQVNRKAVKKVRSIIA